MNNRNDVHNIKIVIAIFVIQSLQERASCSQDHIKMNKKKSCLLEVYHITYKLYFCCHQRCYQLNYQISFLALVQNNVSCDVCVYLLSICCIFYAFCGLFLVILWSLNNISIMFNFMFKQRKDHLTMDSVQVEHTQHHTQFLSTLFSDSIFSATCCTIIFHFDSNHWTHCFITT